ncbi:MAG: hypothetical protein PHF20_01370 [Halothiobacillaceae bacterium]|nr:hypothetical protein [Halothiobacillaceae bacterium]
MADRNDASEIQRDIEFLQELKADLKAGRGGDETRFEALDGKLDDWIHELKTK